MLQGTTNLPEVLKLWVHVVEGRLPLGARKDFAGDEYVILHIGSIATDPLWMAVSNARTDRSAQPAIQPAIAGGTPSSKTLAVLQCARLFAQAFIYQHLNTLTRKGSLALSAPPQAGEGQLPDGPTRGVVCPPGARWSFQRA